MERIGKGGTAVVYKAKRRGAAGFEKQVVVKTILPELAGDPQFVALFTAEAKLSAQLSHSNIAQVQDFGVLRGVPFLEIELLKGWDIKQLWEAVSARGERLPVPIVLYILTEACRGLAYAHTFVDADGALRPIIHRDVSPSNIMVCRDGAVKLLDFGLATVTCGETLSIETFHGKVAYMSPEQLEHQQLDRSADVFAFGVVLFELLTGTRLFAADTDLETLQRVRTFAVERPSRFNRQVPAELDRLVARALARDPQQRFSSAVQLLSALDGLKLRAASRGELLHYIATRVPSLFATTCEGCGASVPCGKVCEACRTHLSESEPPSAAVAGKLVSRRLFVVGTPARGVPVAGRPCIVEQPTIPIDLDIDGELVSPPAASLRVLLATAWALVSPRWGAMRRHVRQRGVALAVHLRRRATLLAVRVIALARSIGARIQPRR